MPAWSWADVHSITSGRAAKSAESCLCLRDTVTCKTEQGRADGHRHEAGGVDAECEELPVALCRISVVPLADNLGRKMPFSSLS
jgi:hypothetical protein